MSFDPRPVAGSARGPIVLEYNEPCGARKRGDAYQTVSPSSPSFDHVRAETFSPSGALRSAAYFD